MENVLKRLSNKKINISLNKNPIKMDQFLSYLTVPVKRSAKHLGCETGWTMLHGENGLVITGGKFFYKGEYAEFLDRLEYKRSLDNPYNNYVNPFYLKDILTKEGMDFFIEYYRDDIVNIMENNQREIIRIESQLEQAKALAKEFDELFCSNSFN